jgi:hypothetical protein
MKSLLKPLLLSATLSTFGLIGVISTASAETKTIQISHDLPMVSYMLAIPKHASEGSSSTKLRIGSPSDDIVEFKSCGARKGNDFYSLASIFNDKLQQMVASFSHNEKSISHQDTEDQLTLNKTSYINNP